MALLLSVLMQPAPAHQASAADTPVAPAQLPTEDVAQIRNIIVGQLDAFKSDDAEKAFSFAAPNVRKIFRTAEVSCTWFGNHTNRHIAPDHSSFA